MNLELKHIAPYLPYDLEFKDPETVVPGVMVAIVAGMPGLLFYEDGDNIEYFDLSAVKPLLRPISDLSLAIFDKMCQDAFGWDESYATTINGYYAVCRKEKDDDDELDAQSDWVDSDYIIAAEEADHDNVISIRKINPKAVFQFDIAWGCSDEMRYFADFNTVEALRQQLFKQHFDVYGLIDAGLALNKLDYK